MRRKDSLETYRNKRHFGRTPEPSGRKTQKRKKPIFVIQKHDARRLHYDFRIEVGDVLKSWAVPKGPSTDPREKRLAVPTEDHPMEYADFEGVIPDGEYGAGTVMLWDRGTYTNTKEKDGNEVPMAKCVEDGHVTIRLRGKKLRGGYALIRTGKPADNRWLMIKMNDENANARVDLLKSQPDSAISGRTLEQIAAEG